jgi:hypothetical protein
VRGILAIALLISVLVAGATAGSAATGHAAGKCSGHPITGALYAVAVVASTKGMTCRAARKIVRAHGRESGDGAYERGGHFRLGKFHCKVFRVAYEDQGARCARPGRSFRVDYGS